MLRQENEYMVRLSSIRAWTKTMFTVFLDCWGSWWRFHGVRLYSFSFARIMEPRVLINNESGLVKYWAKPVFPTDLVLPSMETLYKRVPWTRERVRGKDAARLTVDMSDDPDRLIYPYAGHVKKPLAWTPEIRAIKRAVEHVTGERFNFAVLNWYESGADYIGAHSDSTSALVPGSTIASFSCGAERDFDFIPRGPTERPSLSHSQTTLQRHRITLQSHSILTMGGACQHFYRHALPKRLRLKRPRFNVTFRHILPGAVTAKQRQ